MILTEAEILEMRNAAMPLMVWLANNCHPHVKAIVDSELVEVMEGLATASRVDRQEPHCQCEACVGGAIHASDCAVHNAPALLKGPCDCGKTPNV